MIIVYTHFHRVNFLNTILDFETNKYYPHRQPIGKLLPINIASNHTAVFQIICEKC